VEREEEIIKAKNPHLRDRARVARQVAIGSVIFHDLKRERNKNIDFDWDEVLRWEGDTGAYVQYAHARLCSILRRHGRPATAEVDFCLLNTPEDYALARKLAEFGDEIERTAERLEPFFISRYLLDLCALLSNYYSRHRVLGEDEALSAARVLLMDSVRQTIANGLGLLGVAAPEEM
jgi:arginyl-tRNA synthetase